MTQQPGTIPTCKDYKVQPGDTLRSIAERAYGDGTKWQWIYDRNKMVIGENPDFIKPGQDLFITHPDPITEYSNYTAQTGDTIRSIAERAYCDSKSWEIIWWANQRLIGLDHLDIQPGQVLFIPFKLFRDTHGSGHTT